jgi:molecular chaperone GrpE (heat shock protein)
MLQIISGGAPFGRVEGSRIKDLEKQLEEAKKGQNERVNEIQAEIEDMRKQQEEMMKLLFEHLPREGPHRQ